MGLFWTKLDRIYEEDFWSGDVENDVCDDIFSFTELRSCAEIYRMYNDGILDIEPEFQRDFVWKINDCMRFFDSIIKNLPIPSLCLGFDSKKKKWIVIDGLQRIYTIISFFDGNMDNYKFPNIEDITKKLIGFYVRDIREKSEFIDIRRTIENYSLPITVLRCDLDKKEHLRYLFNCFRRLNSTGLKLTNQEIRNCIYAGPFNLLLRQLDQYPKWRELNKMKQGQSYRLIKQELILRFFAYQNWLDHYNASLAEFLNDFMNEYKSITQDDCVQLRNVFIETVDLLVVALAWSNYGKIKRLSMVVQDALMYGIAKNREMFRKLPDNVKATKIDAILSAEVFSEKNMSEGIAKKPKLIERLEYVRNHIME